MRGSSSDIGHLALRGASGLVLDASWMIYCSMLWRRRLHYILLKGEAILYEHILLSIIVLCEMCTIAVRPLLFVYVFLCGCVLLFVFGSWALFPTSPIINTSRCSEQVLAVGLGFLQHSAYILAHTYNVHAPCTYYRVWCLRQCIPSYLERFVSKMLLK